MVVVTGIEPAGRTILLHDLRLGRMLLWALREDWLPPRAGNVERV